MNYEKHFLKEHIAVAEKEIACLVDLCGRVALTTREVELVQANRFLEDLKRSLQVINDLHDVKTKKSDGEMIRRNYF